MSEDEKWAENLSCGGSNTFHAVRLHFRVFDRETDLVLGMPVNVSCYFFFNS